MDKSILIQSLILAALIILSAYFSAAETAFSSLKLVRLESKLRKSKNHHSLKLYEKFSETLSVILIANNIVNITAASVSLLLFSKLGFRNPIIFSTIFTTVIILIFGEFTPKVLAKKHPEIFAQKLSFPLHVIKKVLAPFTFLIGRFAKNHEDWTTEKELIHTVNRIAAKGELEKSESILINSALKFDDTRVKTIFTKWTDVISIKHDAVVGDAIRLAVEHKYTRIPVIKGKTPIGYVSMTDLIGRSKKTFISKYIREIKFISQNMYLDDALEMIQRERTHILVVTKNLASNKPLGIVTLEDLIEKIIGEVYDETDNAPEVVPVGHNEYIVNGNLLVEKVFKIIKGETPYVTNITFSKWVMSNMSQKNIKENKYSDLKYDKFSIKWIKHQKGVDFFQVIEDE